MIYVVRFGFGVLVQPNDFFNNQNKIFGPENPVFARQRSLNSEPLVQFIPSDFRQIVPLKTEEHRFNQLFRAINGGQIAGTDSFVNLNKAVGFAFGRIFGQRRGNIIKIFTGTLGFERLLYLFVGFITESP